MLDDQFRDLLDVKTLRNSRGPKGPRCFDQRPLSPDELARRRAGEASLVETRKADADKGIATMVRVRAELASGTSEVPNQATHRVLSGEFAGAYCCVLSFDTARGAFIRVRILSDKRMGIIFLKADELVRIDTGRVDENLCENLSAALRQRSMRRGGNRNSN